ncbi:hypothetical protein D3C83_184380 [compost metagenome]
MLSGHHGRRIGRGYEDVEPTAETDQAVTHAGRDLLADREIATDPSCDEAGDLHHADGDPIRGDEMY